MNASEIIKSIEAEQLKAEVPHSLWQQREETAEDQQSGASTVCTSEN